MTTDQPESIKRTRTRFAIIDAAIRVFGEHRPEAPAVDVFTHAASISRGTFYNYFPDRTELQSAAIERVLGFLSDEITPHLETQTDPACIVAIIVQGFFDLMIANPIWGRAYVHISPQASTMIRARDPIGLLGAIDSGIRAGRFAIYNLDAALDIINGSLTAALRSVLDGQRPSSHTQAVTTMLLHAIGLPYPEANEVVSSIPRLTIKAYWFERT